MTIDEFVKTLDYTRPPAPADELEAFEQLLDVSLPADYRRFLVMSNGGHCGGALWYIGPSPEGRETEAGVHHVYGFQRKSCFSLAATRECYQSDGQVRIPLALLPIMDDPFGNAICLGVRDEHYGRVYFWDHEQEPDPEEWDGRVETAGNITLIANSFTVVRRRASPHGG